MGSPAGALGFANRLIGFVCEVLLIQEWLHDSFPVKVGTAAGPAEIDASIFEIPGTSLVRNLAQVSVGNSTVALEASQRLEQRPQPL